MWSTTWRVLYNSADENSYLLLKFGAGGTMFKKYIIYDSELDVFVVRKFLNGETVSWYHVYLVF